MGKHDKFYDARGQALRDARDAGDTKQAAKIIAHVVSQSGDLSEGCKELTEAAKRHEARKRG